MKKIYTLLLNLFGLLAFVWLAAVPSVQAQPYTLSDYVVYTNSEPWQSIEGTGRELTEITATGDWAYWAISNEITLPFQVRYINDMYNKIKVHQSGAIFMGGSLHCPDGVQEDFFTGEYGGCYYDIFQAADLGDLVTVENDQDMPSYIGFVPYSIHPWSGYDRNIPNEKFLVEAQGTAPNRRYVIETTGKMNNADNVTVSFQVVLYEPSSFISKIGLHYGPATGSVSANWQNSYGICSGLKELGKDFYKGTSDTCRGFLAIDASTNKPVPPNAPTYSFCNGCMNEMANAFPANLSVICAILYPYELTFNIPSGVFPLEGKVLSLNAPFIPKIQIANQGLHSFSAVQMRLTIFESNSPKTLGDTVYDMTINLTKPQIPDSIVGISPPIGFPSFTPSSYGYYTQKFTIGTTTPTESYIADNLFTSHFIVSPDNNVASTALLSPTGRTPISIESPVSFRYTNLGVHDQTGVRVSTVIRDPKGIVVYRDSQTLNNWLSGTARDTIFNKSFTPTTNGIYTACGITLMAGDELSTDDTLCSPIQVAYLSDVAAISVFNPDIDEEKPQGFAFKPAAYFQSVGVEDLFDVPVRILIRRCSDNAVVFQADTLIPELNTDAGQVKQFFPSKKGTNDITTLPAGCYNICAIALQADDGDHSNDTACSSFSIIPRLHGDIRVGVNQRFPTISAAVDSMRFRGIDGDLNLILTDAAYSENGHTSVSSSKAAVNFTGIVGTGPKAMVTWKPLKGVSPVITFTGTQTFCFGYPYRSANYMSWDGNNQLFPTPDIQSPEPVKRGITIVDHEHPAPGTAGGIFSMEAGRNNLSFKNLRLIGDGNLSNSLSNIFRMVNIYDINSYLAGDFDTLPYHDIIIDNNEIGNASVGISDLGSTPLFNLGQAAFFDRRNTNNRITRNTIGSSANMIGRIGIQIANEDGLYIGHNDISWVVGTGGTSTVAAIAANIPVTGNPTGFGNVTGLWVDGNKIHHIATASITAPMKQIGIDIEQAALIYTFGTGLNLRVSTLPVNTRNRITNNMIYDFRAPNLAMTTVRAINITTGAASYTVNNDSIFNNSIALRDAESLIATTRVGKPFLWNNIYQDLDGIGSANAVLYNLTVPRPMFSNISSDYNDIDLRSNAKFATVHEYDMTSGINIQTQTLRDLNEWRSYTQQDVHSVTGDPMFSADSLHLPAATTYIVSPASNNGAWLGTSTQMFDYDGDQRTNATAPDIGADEFEGFQFTNDLAVEAITIPSGISQASGVTLVTAENPLHIQALVKNLGSIEALNRTVSFKVESSTDDGVTWTSIGTGSSVYSFGVGEDKAVDFTGPNIIGSTDGKLFRVTVSVAPDQNNANNSLSKTFDLLLKRSATLLSYESSSVQGLRNKDSLALALHRLGVPYDSVDRYAIGSAPIDYTAWWTVAWATGNPSVATNGATGLGGVSLKEEEEIIRFLRAGQTWAKKSFIIAGENIAQYDDTTSPFRQLNNPISDNDFMSNWMHTQFVARHPGLNYPAVPVHSENSYRGLVLGTGVYFSFPDSIWAGSPDVIKVKPVTPSTGTSISRTAYTYKTHPQTPKDSGAGTAWTAPTFNVVFYAFDWADPLQTLGTEDGQASPVNVSGTTRFLRGALDFLQSFKGTVLPVEFVDVKGSALKTGNQITWSVAAQKNVDHYEVEMLEGANWNWVGETKATTATDYSFMHTSGAAFEIGKTFTYRIVSVDLDGSRSMSMTVSFSRTAEGVSLSLDQNFPNPFNGSTMFNFTLPENGTVSLRILDMTGKVIATPVNASEYSAGKGEVKFDASNLASGTYIYELSFVNANGELSKLSRKMTLSK